MRQQFIRVFFIVASLLIGLVIGVGMGAQYFPITITETLTTTRATTLFTTMRETQYETVTNINTITRTTSVYLTYTSTHRVTTIRYLTTTIEVPARPGPNDVIIVSNLTIQWPPNARYRGSPPAIEIRGEVKNIGRACVDYVKIIATFYDAEGRVIGSDFTYSDPSRLYPSQTAPFNILWIDLLALAHQKTKIDITYRQCS